MNKKLFVCLILFFDFMFGNQPNQYLFVTNQSVFRTNWRTAIIKPNAIAFNNSFLTDGESSNLTSSDAIQKQNTQSNVDRATFGRIMLESVGGITVGFLIAGAWRKIAYPQSYWPWWASNGIFDYQYLVGFSVGSAVGVSISGHLLSVTKGSFLKSLIGSSLGTGLGACIVTLTNFMSIGWEPFDSNNCNWSLFFAGQTLALIFPTVGSILGYNLRSSDCYIIPPSNKSDNTINSIDNFSQIYYQIKIIKIKF